MNCSFLCRSESNDFIGKIKLIRNNRFYIEGLNLTKDILLIFISQENSNSNWKEVKEIKGIYNRVTSSNIRHGNMIWEKVNDHFEPSRKEIKALDKNEKNLYKFLI